MVPVFRLKKGQSKQILAEDQTCIIGSVIKRDKPLEFTLTNNSTVKEKTSVVNEEFHPTRSGPRDSCIKKY